MSITFLTFFSGCNAIGNPATVRVIQYPFTNATGSRTGFRKQEKSCVRLTKSALRTRVLALKTPIKHQKKAAKTAARTPIRAHKFPLIPPNSVKFPLIKQSKLEDFAVLQRRTPDAPVSRVRRDAAVACGNGAATGPEEVDPECSRRLHACVFYGIGGEGRTHP